MEQLYEKDHKQRKENGGIPKAKSETVLLIHEGEACKALARPTVEYSSSVWDCYTGKNIVKVEMVQRRAARRVLSRCNH